MTLRLSSEVEYKALVHRMKHRDEPAAAPEPRKPSKYRAEICEADSIKFRSKKERKRYLELKALAHAGEIQFFLMQVPFRLPGNTKYLLDFMVFWKDGKVTLEDVKGRRLPMYIMKKKQVEALYPVVILEA